MKGSTALLEHASLIVGPEAVLLHAWSHRPFPYRTMTTSSAIDRPKIKLLAVSKIPLFTSLSEAERARLTELLILREYKKGACILISADLGQDIMFVADGAVDVKRASSDGREVILVRLGVGAFFGEIAFLTGARRSADVVAAEDSMILCLRASDFEALLKTNPGFSRALLVDLAHRVAAASTRIADLALLDVYCRVHRTLLGLAVRDSATSALIVEERPTHKDLAAMVGTSREMVTRALAKLETEEVIVLEEKRVRIIGSVDSAG